MSAARPLTVLHAAPLQWSGLSGLSTAVLGMLQAQSLRADLRPALLRTVGGAGLGEGASALPCPAFWAASSPRPLAQLPAPFQRPDLLVLHSTYVPLHLPLALEAALRRIPYLLVPHGGLTRGVQANGRVKKALVNAACFRALAHHARAVQFLSAREARDSAGWGRAHFVVGNGTPLPPPGACARPGQGAGLRLVFIGRLEPVQKGLDLLLEACAQLRGPLAARGARVELYGPDHRGGEAWLRARIGALGLQGQVHLGGVVTGEAKEQVLQGADLFLHPSRFEGHPMAVLEALAHGVPCLVTPGTGACEEVAGARAGWGVEERAEALAGALREALEAGPALQAYGARARALAAERFSWDAVAEAVAPHYRRLATERPARGPRVLPRRAGGLAP